MSNCLLRFLAGSIVIAGVSSCERDVPTATETTTLPPVSGPALTPGAGLVLTTPIRGSLGDFKYKTIHDGFHFEFKSHGAADIVTASGTGGTGAHTGWHSHPGPTIVIVSVGTVTSYRIEKGECIRTEYPAGSALVEGTAPHIVVNEGSTSIEIVAVFFTPAGVPQRIDVPDPGIC